MSQTTTVTARGGEQGRAIPIPHRCDRFFKLKHAWYFTTREGFSMGPFDSYELAKSGAKDYLAFVSTADTHVLKALRPEQKGPELKLKVRHA